MRDVGAVSRGEYAGVHDGRRQRHGREQWISRAVGARDCHGTRLARRTQQRLVQPTGLYAPALFENIY